MTFAGLQREGAAKGDARKIRHVLKMSRIEDVSRLDHAGHVGHVGRCLPVGPGGSFGDLMRRVPVQSQITLILTAPSQGRDCISQPRPLIGDIKLIPL